MSSVATVSEFRVEEIPALVDQAVEQRLARTNLAAELIAAVPPLARAICDELTARRFYGPFHIPGTSDKFGDPHLYEITQVKWGPIRRRQRALVLFRSRRGFGGDLLFDPTNAGAAWDPASPPEACFRNLDRNMFVSWQYANAAVLADFAKDAPALIENVIRRETAATDHLTEGVAAADEAFNLLTEARR